MTIRVVVAEDSLLVREGIAKLLDAQADIEVVALVEDLPDLLAAVAADAPDVVVTDIRMPPTGTDEGVQAATRLRDTNPGLGVVVLSQYAEPAYALALLDGGSERRAYLLKERISDPDQLAAAIREVDRGGSVIDPKVVEVLVSARSRARTSPLTHLTPREARGPRRDRPGQEQRGGRGGARPVGTGGREAHQLPLREARALGGAAGPPPGEGGPALPGRGRRPGGLAPLLERVGARWAAPGAADSMSECRPRRL